MRYTALSIAAAALVTILGSGAIRGAVQAQSVAAQPLATVLQPDGSLDIAAAQNRPLDPAGYALSVDAQGQPRFTPLRRNTPSAPQAIEKWSSEYAFSGTDNIVTALAVYNGKIYVGGYFSAIGPLFANRIAVWDGMAWSPMGEGVDGNVHAIAVNSTGVYIGGDFIYAGDAFCQRIARWDGARWNPLGEGFNAKVRALAFVGNWLYAGGEFTASGTTNLSRIARWDGARWNAVGAGANGSILAFTVSGADLYVGGEFTFIGSTPVNRVARWTGSAWFTLGQGCNNTVRTLAFSNGLLYVGGDFTQCGTTVARYIATWNGAAWSEPGGGAGDRVNAIVADGSTVYVGGHFNSLSDIPANYIGKWTGTYWEPLGAGVNSFVYCLAFGDGKLLIGGDFNFALNGLPPPTRSAGKSRESLLTTFIPTGEIAANHIVSWNGLSFTPLYNGKGFSGNVYAILVDGSDVYVGGSFTHGGGISASNIIKYDGMQWSALGSGTTGTVFALTKHGSDIIAGGRFSKAGGVSVSNIARWDKHSWSALGTGINFGTPGTGVVYALASDGSDSLVAGGEFNTAGGVTAWRVALWRGSSWEAIGPGMDNTVYTLAYESFMFYAGGKFRFSQSGGFFYNYAAMWNGNRSAWFSLGSGLDSTVYVIRPGGGGVIYVGGNFTSVGGQPAQRLARWDGSLWVPMGSTNNRIRAIDVKDNKLHIGGDFTQAGGLPASRFAIYDMGTTTWSAPGNGLDSTVFALGDGDLYIGGAFNGAGSKPSFHFAQWLENSYVYLKARVLLQGAYNPATNLMSTALRSGNHLPLVSPYVDHRAISAMPADITDWVLVELRDGANQIIARKSILLHRDGKLRDDDGVSDLVTLEGVATGNYYLVVRHRNHIAVMSAMPQSLNQGAPALYDFSSGPGQYFGGGGVELEPGVWGLWTGDINQDGMVTTRDHVIWFNANFNSESGYSIADLDLNGSVATSDHTLWQTNARIDPKIQVP